MQALQAQHAEAQSILTAGGALAEPAAGSRRGAACGARRSPAAAAAAARGARLCAEATRRPGTFVRGDRKVGRNEPCPCGSGKKFKHCHGTLARRGVARRCASACAWSPAPSSTRAGRVLIAERPAGKHLAGRWEFPGGKIGARREPRAGAGARAARRARHRRARQRAAGDAGARLPRSRGRAAPAPGARLGRHRQRPRRPAPQMGAARRSSAPKTSSRRIARSSTRLQRRGPPPSPISAATPRPQEPEAMAHLAGPDARARTPGGSPAVDVRRAHRRPQPAHRPRRLSLQRAEPRRARGAREAAARRRRSAGARRRCSIASTCCAAGAPRSPRAQLEITKRAGRRHRPLPDRHRRGGLDPRHDRSLDRDGAEARAGRGLPVGDDAAISYRSQYVPYGLVGVHQPVELPGLTLSLHRRDPGAARRLRGAGEAERGHAALRRAACSAALEARARARRRVRRASGRRARPARRWSRWPTSSASPAASRTGRKVAENAARAFHPRLPRTRRQRPADHHRVRRPRARHRRRAARDLPRHRPGLPVARARLRAPQPLRALRRAAGREGREGRAELARHPCAARSARSSSRKQARHRRRADRRRAGQGRARAHRRRDRGPRRQVAAADGGRRRRPFDGADGRRDLRPGDPGDGLRHASTRPSRSPTKACSGSPPRSSPARSRKPRRSAGASTPAASASTTAR